MDKKILKKIKKMKQSAPLNWAEIISQEMGVSPITVRAYARGARMLSSGKHKEVLRILIDIAEKDTAEKMALLQN